MTRTEDVTPALLAAFVAVVEAGQFTLAASRLHVSQPAISRQVQRLERTLGRQLLVRTGSSVRLTTDGGEVLSHARQVLSAIDALILNAGTPRTVVPGQRRDLAPSATSTSPNREDVANGGPPTASRRLPPPAPPASSRATNEAGPAWAEACRRGRCTAPAIV